MSSSLLLVFVFLALVTVATPKANHQCPACGAPTLDLEIERKLLLDLAKRTILDKLHLSELPTVNRPLSKAALRTALQHFLGPHRSVFPEDSRTQEYEIISFAKTGFSTINQTRLDFYFSTNKTAGITEVQQASLMFFVQLPPKATGTRKVKILVADPHNTNLTLVTKHLLEVDASGWYKISLGREALTACSQGYLTLELVPEGQAAQGLVIRDEDDHRPFVVARVRVGGKHQVHRRGLECQGGRSRMCCRQQLFVNFHEIGWDSWIIHPKGYAMNFCTGPCSLLMAGSPGIAASFHTAVLNLIKVNSRGSRSTSCCVPTAWKPLTLLYFDKNSNIVKSDIPNMVVEACGCS
ncbi:inhibin beta C chain [Rhynchocyon petersi]